MAVMTGKRKRLETEADDQDAPQDGGAMRALFQRAFEAKFKPLERMQPTITKPEPEVELDDEEDETDSYWSGLSEDEGLLETIQYDSSHTNDLDIQRHERKAFMSSKPPSSTEGLNITSKAEEPASEDDASDLANKKHDLALQRLLKESHLLDPASFRNTISQPHGKGRLKALDLRLKGLGAKESSSEQHKMPLSHRKGIVAKATNREERRRQDALENGVVLEKAKPSSKGSKYREKGVGGPAIGKFKGGTLKLGSRDLRSLQGDPRRRRR